MARLEELRLSVVEGRCAALLAVRAHEVAVAELEVHVRAHPLREELGIDPGRALQRLIGTHYGTLVMVMVSR